MYMYIYFVDLKPYPVKTHQYLIENYMSTPVARTYNIHCVMHRVWFKLCTRSKDHGMHSFYKINALNWLPRRQAHNFSAKFSKFILMPCDIILNAFASLH